MQIQVRVNATEPMSIKINERLLLGQSAHAGQGSAGTAERFCGVLIIVFGSGHACEKKTKNVAHQARMLTFATLHGIRHVCAIPYVSQSNDDLVEFRLKFLASYKLIEDPEIF